MATLQSKHCTTGLTLDLAGQFGRGQLSSQAKWYLFSKCNSRPKEENGPFRWREAHVRRASQQSGRPFQVQMSLWSPWAEQDRYNIPRSPIDQQFCSERC